jgi:hypothetical protein
MATVWVHTQLAGYARCQLSGGMHSLQDRHAANCLGACTACRIDKMPTVCALNYKVVVNAAESRLLLIMQ